VSDLLTNEQIDALDKYGDEPEIFAHARAANAEIKRLQEFHEDDAVTINNCNAEIARLTSRLEEAQRAWQIMRHIKEAASTSTWATPWGDEVQAVLATDTEQSKGETAQPPDSASEEQDEGTPDQSWIVALHNLRICADELHRIGHGGEARMIEDAVNRIVAFRQHIAVRARAEVVERIIDEFGNGTTLQGNIHYADIRALVSPTTEEA